MKLSISLNFILFFLKKDCQSEDVRKSVNHFVLKRLFLLLCHLIRKRHNEFHSKMKTSQLFKNLMYVVLLYRALIIKIDGEKKIDFIV